MIIVDEDDHFMLRGLFSSSNRDSPTLLELSGADVMVSPLDKPATTETLIKRHVTSGAYLYYIVNVLDFVNVNLDLEHLVKMKSMGCKQNQAVLLYTGLMDITKDGFIMVDNIGTKHDVVKVLARLDAWNTLGGCSLNTIRHSVTIKFLQYIDDIFTDYKNNEPKT